MKKIFIYGLLYAVFMSSISLAGSVQETQKLCDKGDSVACKKVGYVYYYSGKTEDNLKKGLAAFKKSCADTKLKKIDRDCFMVSVFEREMKSYDILLSDKEAKNAEESCNQGDMVNCTLLAHIRKERHEYKKAFEANKKTCNGKLMNDMGGCRKVGQAYAKGLGVKKDDVKAYKILSYACKNNDLESCEEVARMTMDGRGVKANMNQSYKIFKYTCDKGQIDGCLALSDGFRASKKPKLAKQYFQKAVDNGTKECKKYNEPCIKIGWAYEVEKDTKTALSYYKQACDRKSAKGCIFYYNLLKKTKL